jgi:hypothetical protein
MKNMKTTLSLLAASMALFSQAQVIIERSDNNKHIIIELDSVTHNDASEFVLKRGPKAMRSFTFIADGKEDQKLSPEQRAHLMTQQMALHLDLSEKQEKQVANINTKHHKTMQALQEKEQGFEKRSAVLDEQIKHQRALKEVLDAAQYAQFKEMHKKMREEHHPTEAPRVRMMRWNTHEGDMDASEIHKMRIEGKRMEVAGPHAKMMIRKKGGAKGAQGMAFISASEKPLVIIDGKESDSATALEDLNPSKIDKMEVLKGEKAVEQYGEKAKNGVILITTKK